MQNKLFTGAVILLLVALVVQSLYGTYITHKSAKAIESLHQYKEDKIDVADTEIQTKEDSLGIVIVAKDNKIKSLQNRLNKKLKTAKVNNEKYRQYMEHARTVTNTDSLADALTNRYKER